MARRPVDEVRELFCKALDVPEPDRASFLRDRCADDTDLVAEVESLLALDSSRGSFIDTPAVPRPAVDDAVIGRQVGRYEILRVIGTGGMGTVYEARQDRPHRLVALKVLRRGAASPVAMKRFQHEVEILGRLHHPNIAQIYDAGTFDAGEGAQPYFAMELVQGRPLVRYAEAAGLRTRQRLALFAGICDAVQYAHHKGVIHRDLKPDNILVDEHGAPKILDFGIARATDSDIQATTVHTDIGQLIGTVPYMSPEQVTGDPADVDPRSDVYSLGVVLYELLCGQLPHDLGKRSVPEAVRIIREEDPTPLSSVNRVFRGDVDTIVVKALEKEKSRRYQSPGALAADVRRYLKNEPILARPASTFYQLRKFARRNRTLVGGVTASFVFLVAGMLATTWQSVQARREAARSTAIAEILASALTAADWAVANRKRSAEAVLDAAVEAVDDQLSDEPAIEAEIKHIIGLAYASMTAMDKAIAQLRRARQLRIETLGPDHEDTLATAQSLAETMHEQGLWLEGAQILRDVVDARRRTLGDDHPDTLWAMTWLARSLNVQDEAHVAEPMARRALEGLERQLGPGDARTIRARYVYAGCLHRTGKFDEFEVEARRRLADARKYLGPDHKMTLEMTHELGASLWVLRGDREEAEPLIRGAIEANRLRFGDDDLHTNFWTLIYGALLAEAGEVEAAERHLRDGLAGLERVLGEQNVRTAYAMASLAEFLDPQGRLEEAEPLLRRTVQVRRDLLTVRHRDTSAAISYLGWLQYRLGKYGAAQANLQEALDLQEHLHGSGHANTLGTRLHLGQCLRDSGQLPEAEKHLLAALDGYRALAQGDGEQPAGHPSASGNERPTQLQAGPDVVSVLGDLVQVYEAWGKPEKAAEYRALLREAEGAEAPE